MRIYILIKCTFNVCGDKHIHSSIPDLSDGASAIANPRRLSKPVDALFFLKNCTVEPCQNYRRVPFKVLMYVKTKGASNWEARPCLVTQKIQKLFKIPIIKSCDTCMEH
jgi:hypothetical protein